ncbi:radical SAM protein [Methanolobus halotolerans]|uniref:Radical SAM protein n=1 Tax=Methanolobus halotolerans TaxID=2052935 RepID=A0A4E0PW22_9EURY|nr:radical SAM protein [Methanolobus halotolerans]TGC08493.1 radical SAM protein [Methanolobus halotolerans]
MSEVSQSEIGSFNTFLSEGCKLCQKGAKMVLFVTGICPRNCFYCPVSHEKRTEVVYANERLVNSDQDIIKEARQMDALGTGITGGEPLLRPEDILHYIKLLKDEFGKEHHIHLYTSLTPDRETVGRLAEAGLDEIRFHPPADIWTNIKKSRYARSIEYAKDYALQVGVEVPAIEGIDKIAEFTRSVDCFLNLNELEFSDSNAEDMKLRGFVLENDISNAVAGSQELARKIIPVAGKMHFCSSVYKDAIQLRERLIRIARNTARDFDDITDDGTIIYGKIICENDISMQKIIECLREHEVPDDMMKSTPGGIETAWWILEDLAELVRQNAGEIFIVERYPFEKGLIVEKIPV